MQIETFKNGFSVTSEKTFPSGMHCVWLRDSRGEIVDKVRCDSAGMAREYKAAFVRIAKASKS